MNIVIVLYELIRISIIGIQKGVFYKPNGKKLASYLESLGPIFTKFGQLLSTRTDILDLTTAKELESLSQTAVNHLMFQLSKKLLNLSLEIA